MAILHTNPDHLSEIISSSIKNDLEKTIKKKLLENIDHIISEVARDYAEKTVMAVQSYHQFHPSETFDRIQVALVFNNKDVHYVDNTSKDRN